MFDKDFGIAQNAVQLFNNGQHLSIFRTIPLFMPAVAFVTVWWLLGFNVLLFIAGLRNISTEIYEAAGLDGAGRWAQFTRITWPLIWPVTVLVFTIQLILQLKIFDQVYLLRQRRQGRRDDGHGPVHIHGGLSDEQGRSRRRRRRWCFSCSSSFCRCCSFSCSEREGPDDRFGRDRRRSHCAADLPPARPPAPFDPSASSSPRHPRRRRPVGVPALLGVGDDVQARIRGRAARRGAVAGALHARELRSRPAADEDRASGM